MASSSSECSDNEAAQQQRLHRKKEKNHKKTKKRYRTKSDDEEKGYKKIKRKKEKKNKKSRHGETSESEEKSPISLPPAPTSNERHLVQQQPAETNSYGPALPPHLLSRSSGSSTEESKYIGPALPPAPLQALHKESPPPSYYSSESDYNSNDDDDDMGVGPLPGVTNVALEQRALEIKLGKVSGSGDGSGANKEKAREEWMTELPQVKTVADLGLGARQFRTKERPDFSDRSSWTDTPHDRDKKSTKPPTEVDLKKQHEVELKKKLLKDRDKQQEKMAKELKKKHKRDKSLYELHQDKLNKAKKEKEDELQVRRPFDRNVDLQANRFDEAQKNAVIKKAQLLDSRFSSGSSKYL